MCPCWPGHPDYQKIDLVRGVVVVHLSWPGDRGYKKNKSTKIISEKKSLSWLRDHGYKKMYKRKKTKKI